ncbi:Ff.00g065830.m01.CDS01 [Fusarium sp. VM40]|nr:Ff.00g065830.m01.CDS01 [Fusarium sp. VM40]
MPICNLCHAAICDLYPKVGDVHPQRETTLRYPPYDADNNQACWICIRHAEYLEEFHHEVYRLWLKHQLLVTFQAEYGYMEEDKEVHANHSRFEAPVLTRGRRDRKMEVHQLFLTRKHKGSDGAGCLIELKFYKQGDIPETRSYVQNTVTNEINIRQIQDWVNNCERLHSACHSYSETPWYPTRLLDLGQGKDTLNLIISEEMKPIGPYMTLSHRWSNYQYEKLTSESLGRFTCSIDMKSLPRMFQEAINMTRSLGIRYLWIDSLCIMQDKACGDWKIEAFKMGQVYANTYLNLSASYAVDDGENPSIFSPEPWNCVSPSVLNLPDGRELKRKFLIDGDLWTDEVDASPLMGRGWVFQERFLSPRVVHFGMRQLAWECDGGSALEMFPTSLPPGFEDFFKTNVCVPIMQSMQTTDPADFTVRWRKIVTSYSVCDLTFHTDKLVAFAEVAKLVESRRGDEYLAGMWKSTLREDLAWWLSQDTDRSILNTGAAQRAPSWSWLSLNGEICFYPPPSAHHRQEYFCHVLGTPTSEHVGSSVLVARGILELRGKVFPITSLEWLEGNVRFFQIDNLRFETSEGPESTHFDYDRTRAEISNLCSQQELYMLPLYATGRLLISILVSKLFTNPAWRRVGAVCIQFANIPPESDKPCLEGWVPIPHSDWAIHGDGYNFYTQISEAFKAGNLETVSLV